MIRWIRRQYAVRLAARLIRENELEEKRLVARRKIEWVRDQELDRIAFHGELKKSKKEIKRAFKHLIKRMETAK